MATLRTFFRRNALDVGLWALFAAFTVLMLKASTDPSPDWAKGTWLQRALATFPTGNQVIFDVSVGVIVSLFVYVLVVRVPESKKRSRLKASLRRQYSNLKEDCIMQFLWACGESADLDLVEQLKDRAKFKEYFNQDVSADQNRWHSVLNGMDETKVQTIVQELSIFRKELEYTLTLIDVHDQQVFAFLRQLTRVLHRSERWTDDYDELKSMSSFLWSMHTGWDWVKGYTEQDSIGRMIEAI